MLVALFFVVCSNTVFAAPNLINFQGVLTDSVGAPITNASQQMTFRLYDAETAGILRWEEASTVDVQNGNYSLLLGSVTPFPAELFENDNLWLEIVVGSEVLGQRQRLASAPYALQAANVAPGSIDLADLAAPCADGETLVQSGGSWICSPPVSSCNPGDFVNCYTGTPGTKGVGPCVAGERTCAPQGVWGGCTGEVVPDTEYCDGVDNDCNGQIDDSCLTLQTYYADYDQDGLGVQGNSSLLSAPSYPYTALTTGDCNDAASSCTDNCNDADGDAVYDCMDLCLDVDGDDYGIDQSLTVVGTGTVAVGDCTSDGTVSCNFADATCQGLDCNDAAFAINGGVTEVCRNAIDDNCDGQTDENCPDCSIDSSGGESVTINGSTIGYYALNAAGLERFDIELLNYPGGPGSYNVTNENYSTCEICVLIYELDGAGSVTRTYLAEAGTLEITSDTPTFTGSFTGGDFVEVVIDWGTLVSTPVQGGATRCVDGFNFNATP